MRYLSMAAATVFAILVSLFASPGQAQSLTPLSTKKAEILVVGGKEVSPGRYPWQVALVSAEQGDFVTGIFCGGTLIDSKWVLTAAHCFFDSKTCAEYSKNRYYVAYGSTDLAASLSLNGASAVHVREGYKCGSSANDIALILLKQAISGVPAVSLASEADRMQYAAPGRTLTTSGWGITAIDGWPSRNLLEVDIRVVANTTCKAHYGDQLTNAVICAGEAGKDSCHGDSGGPLFAKLAGSKSVQLGVVSFGDGCGKPNAPGVYTDVVAHLEWIQKTIGDHTPSKCSPTDIAKHLC